MDGPVDEEATFEARPVLAPGRARGARFGLLVPVVVFVVIAWAALNGPRPDRTTAVVPDSTVSVQSVAIESPPAAETPFPAEVIGLAVQPLGELQVGRLGFDSVVAIAGWYVPTAITDCPPLPAIYHDGALPYFRGDADKSVFCVRSGVLYPSRPNLSSDGTPDVVPAGVAVEVVVGVIMPLDLETVGTDASQVVVIGRFGKTSEGCRNGVGCSRELLVDHVAWTPDA